MEIKSLLIRLDEESLAAFLSKSAFKVLTKLDPNLVRLESLSKLVHEKISKDVMLRDPIMRNILFNVMNKNETIMLFEHIGQSHSANIFDKLQSISFSKNSENEKKLFSFFNTDFPNEIIEEHSDIVVIEPVRSLFDYQYKAMKSIETHLNDSGRALLHMPTGAGKTRTAMRLVISHMLKKKSTLVIWLAYNEELCEQAIEEFSKTWKFVGDRKNVQIMRFFGSHKLDILSKTQDHSGIFLVAGLSKIYNSSRNPNFLSKLADRVSLVVIDEAHQAVAKTYKFILDQLVEKNDSVQLLGLSATPGRTNDSNKLATFFKRKKVTIDSNDPVRYLITGGYLAEPDTQQLPYDMGQLTPQESTKLATAYDIPTEILEKLAAEEMRNIMIIHAIEDLITEKHKRIIVFGATVKHAQDIAIILTARNYQAYYITSQTPSHIRQQIISDFQRDDNINKILCNFGVLTMGFDAPKTSAVVIARPTKSLVLYSQMIGRAIRGVNASGTAKCSIRTVVDSTLEGHISISDAFLNWEDIWE